jgi:hypothetical protein
MRDSKNEPLFFKPPSLRVVLIALVPFVAMCFSVAWWDRVDPMIFGIPFNLFWLISWIVLSSLCMWIVHRMENSPGAAGEDT